VLAEAFAQDAVWRIDALCDVDNRASVRLLQALGFAQEGVLGRHSVHPM
jgi:RimJ/RimL family protein N-acetyltransferase